MFCASTLSCYARPGTKTPSDLYQERCANADGTLGEKRVRMSHLGPWPLICMHDMCDVRYRDSVYWYSDGGMRCAVLKSRMQSTMRAIECGTELAYGGSDCRVQSRERGRRSPLSHPTGPRSYDPMHTLL
eukprot:1045477-Rhodomonas_salina.1